MFRLNLSTDYALRALIFMARGPGEQTSVREVAAFYGISPDHVSKVTQQLTRSGYLRGRGGGLRLARDPRAVNVGEIVELFEGPVALLECVTSENVCVIQPNCRLRHALERAGAHLIEELKQVTLADLVSPGAPALVQLAGITGAPSPQ